MKHVGNVGGIPVLRSVYPTTQASLSFATVTDDTSPQIASQQI